MMGIVLWKTLEDEQANTFKQAFDGEKIYKILSPSTICLHYKNFLCKNMEQQQEGNLTKQVVKKIKENFTEFAEIILR